MRYALIKNNQVIDIFIQPEEVSIEECFTPEIASLYIPCPDNISEGDFYDADTQEFSESPDKKFPSYANWLNSIRTRTEQLSEFLSNLNPTINDLQMNYERLAEYKTALGFVISGVDEMVKVDGKEFSGDDFKLMINALKKFEEDKTLTKNNHLANINSYKNASDIDNHDITSGWPETVISI